MHIAAHYTVIYLINTPQCINLWENKNAPHEWYDSNNNNNNSILSFRTCETKEPSRKSSYDFHFFFIGLFSQIPYIVFWINLSRKTHKHETNG